MNALKTFLLSAALLISAITARALPTPIELWPNDSVSYPGLSGGLGDADVHDWLAAVIVNYNSVTGSSLPALLPGSTALPSSSYSQGEGTLSVTGLSGYEYIVMHYGNDTDGVKNLDAWYLNGVTDWTFDIPDDYVNKKGKFYGISFVRVYNGEGVSVPDTAASVALLGMSLLTLAAIARKRR